MCSAEPPQAIGHVNVEQVSDVSETVSVSITRVADAMTVAVTCYIYTELSSTLAWAMWGTMGGISWSVIRIFDACCCSFLTTFLLLSCLRPDTVNKLDGIPYLCISSQDTDTSQWLPSLYSLCSLTGI